MTLGHQPLLKDDCKSLQGRRETSDMEGNTNRRGEGIFPVPSAFPPTDPGGRAPENAGFRDSRAPPRTSVQRLDYTP